MAIEETTARLLASSLGEEQDEQEDHEWTSVLPLLDAAADEMKLGDLLSGRCFDLQDAMSAIEIMDPQMDTGMVKEKNPDEPDEVPPPPGPDVPAAQLIGLLDEIMCAELGWYGGLTLAQTVYRIEWLQNAHEVEHLPLRATLIATARAVAAARAIVLRGDVHEEEDFAGSLSGLNLHDNVSDNELVAMLNEAEEQSLGALRAAKEAAGYGDTGDAAPSAPAAASSSVPPTPEAVGLAEAVLCRVRYRRGFCGALLSMSRPSTKSVEVAKRMLAFAEAQLADIARTVPLGAGRTELSWCMKGIALRKKLGASPAKKVELIGREVRAARRASPAPPLLSVRPPLPYCSAGVRPLLTGRSRPLVIA